MDKSWSLEDAQQIANESPYTFYKPSNEVISLLKIGDGVKLIFPFESDDPEAPRAERMWVEIMDIKQDGYVGVLDNAPIHIKDLKYKDVIEFEVCHIIDTSLDDPVPHITEKYIKRCFVTHKVLYEGEPVGYLYREEPDYDDDSGWRIMTGNETDEYMDNSENTSYVSLGAVLREDDSFLKLLDSEIGTAFSKDADGNFIKLDDET